MEAIFKGWYMPWRFTTTGTPAIREIDNFWFINAMHKENEEAAKNIAMIEASIGKMVILSAAIYLPLSEDLQTYKIKFFGNAFSSL